MPKHYRDNSLSSLESFVSHCSNAEESIIQAPQEEPINHLFDQQQYASFDEISTTFSNMQEEYNSSTKQPTPGRPKMARILATSSPEISALCRKTFSNPTGGICLPPFELDNDSKDENPFRISNAQYDPYTFSSDSSNFSMSSSSLESHVYPPENIASSASFSTWEIPSSVNQLDTKTAQAWVKSSSGNATERTAGSTTTGARSSIKSTKPPKPLYVNVSSPHLDEPDGLNYGSDWELEEALSKSLNNMQLFHPEPWRRDSLSSLNSAPTPHSAKVVCGGHQRPTLHRRLSFDQLPTPDMIMNEPVVTSSSLLQPALLTRSASDRPHNFPLSSVGVPRRQHRRNTTQLIVQSPLKPLT